MGKFKPKQVLLVSTSGSQSGGYFDPLWLHGIVWGHFDCHSLGGRALTCLDSLPPYTPAMKKDYPAQDTNRQETLAWNVIWAVPWAALLWPSGLWSVIPSSCSKFPWPVCCHTPAFNHKRPGTALSLLLLSLQEHKSYLVKYNRSFCWVLLSLSSLTEHRANSQHLISICQPYWPRNFCSWKIWNERFKAVQIIASL